MRKCACVVAVFVFCAGVSLAGDKTAKGKQKGVVGKVKTVDATAGTITVIVKQKQEKVDKNFKIEDTSKVVVFNGEDKKELTAKEGLKSDQLKAGVRVRVLTDEAGKVTELQVGIAKKKKQENK